MKALAESMILQSLEDLYDFRFRAESLSFFSGPEFRICAQMAGMGIEEKIKLLTLVRKISRIPQASNYMEMRGTKYNLSRLPSNDNAPHRKTFRPAGV